MVAVYTGSDRDFATIAFGIPNLNTVQYLNNQFINLDTSIYRDTSFIDRAYNAFNEFGGSDALSKARALLNVTNTLVDPNVIRYLPDIVSVQTAPPLMQRYIMANPLVREWYHDNRLDGYSETYRDAYPSDIGESHPDYQRVMDGVCMESDDEDIAFTVTMYCDPLSDSNEPDLLLEEKVDILNLWDDLERYLKYGDDDPTNPYGGSL